MFDFAIIGAGISGASIAYFLNQSGKKVIVIDQAKIASGGSGAAGAFLSPKICSDSKYSKFINESFKFSINFYQDNFSNFLRSDGMLRLFKDKEDRAKCLKFEIDHAIDLAYFNQDSIHHVKQTACEFGGYFFKEGALIDSIGVIKSMLQDIRVIEDTRVEKLMYQDGMYKIAGIRAKGVVLCTGSSKDFAEVDYCMLKKIYGHRLDVRASLNLPYHVHKECSVSSNHDGLVHIGATHIPSYKYDNQYDYADEINAILEKANTHVDLGNYKVQEVHFGVRSSTIDFFPILGKVINQAATLGAFPYIKNGSKVPSEKYLYYPDLYIHSGHGARGFVLAPKTAAILSEHICTDAPIDDNLSTKRLFLKHSRR